MYQLKSKLVRETVIKKKLHFKTEVSAEELVDVIGLHAVQFGNNWMKTFRGEPKLDDSVDRVQFGCQRNFFESNYSQNWISM